MSFEDIKGQGSIASARIFSSYLFTGPDAAAKLAAAKNFAKAVNCKTESAPCDACVSCKKIDSETYPDVFFIRPSGASSSLGIDEIRTVIARANLKPYEAKYKVFIMESAEAMNAEASNAFLKTLEEPPADTIFILLSLSKELLLPTIVSRCHAVTFPEAPRLDRFSPERLKKALGMEYDNRDGLKENIDMLASYMRDMFLYKAIKNEAVLFHRDKADGIKRQSEKFTLEEMDCLIKEILRLRSYIDYNVNMKIIVDMLRSKCTKLYR